MHGLENPMGAHAGDMPDIEIDADGNATYEFLNEAVTLEDTEGRSILAGDGTAIVIHENPDDHVSDPAGNAGERIACGVISAQQESGARSAEPEGGVGVLVPAPVTPTGGLSNLSTCPMVSA